MSVEHFKVVFSGQILDGFDRANVRHQFSRSFRAPEKLVDRVFGGGAVVIKKDLEHQTAIRLAELLNNLGMQSRLKVMPPVIATDHLYASSSRQQLRAERIDALSVPMGSKQAFQSTWKIMVPFILVLFIAWRWYDRLVPDAFTESELKEGYVEACFEYEGCMELLDSQWDQCFKQADYSRYQDADATQILVEEEAFVGRLHQCLVDEDGEAMFH